MGVFLIPVYVKALLTVSDIRRRERGLSRLIYVIYSNGTKLVNQKKNAMQQIPSKTCSDIRSIILSP